MTNMTRIFLITLAAGVPLVLSSCFENGFSVGAAQTTTEVAPGTVRFERGTHLATLEVGDSSELFIDGMPRLHGAYRTLCDLARLL